MAVWGQHEERRPEVGDDTGRVTPPSVSDVEVRISPPNDAPPPAAEPESGDSGTERPSRPYGRLLVAAALVVLAMGAVAIVATLSDPHRLGFAFSGGGRSADPTVAAADPGGAGAAADRPKSGGGEVLTAALDGRRRATFELADGLTSLDVRVDDLGEDLYRISAPADAALRPRPAVRGDRVRLALRKTGRPGPAMVEVVLNARVTWRLLLAGGVAEQRLDLGGARLAGVDLVGGATRTDLRLPRLTGTLTVRVTGGVNRLDIVAPGEPPVRVRAAVGAGSITVRNEHTDGVAARTDLRTAGWDRADDRLYVDLVAGANAVTVSAG